jgi:hypothetical protein
MKRGFLASLFLVGIVILGLYAFVWREVQGVGRYQIATLIPGVIVRLNTKTGHMATFAFGTELLNQLRGTTLNRIPLLPADLERSLRESAEIEIEEQEKK